VTGGKARVVSGSDQAIVKMGAATRSPSTSRSGWSSSRNRLTDGWKAGTANGSSAHSDPRPAGHAVVAVAGPTPGQPRLPAGSPYVADATLTCDPLLA